MEVRFCRGCGAELEAVAALLEGRLVVSEPDPPKGFFSAPSWEMALISFALGVAILIASFILGFDPNTGAPTPWLAFLFVAFPIVGFGIAQIIRVSNKDKEKERRQVNARAAAPDKVAGGAPKGLPESRADYVSPHESFGHRTADPAPGSVVDATTRHLEMEAEATTKDLRDPETEKN